MKRVILLASALAIAACQQTAPEVPEARTRPGELVLTVTSPARQDSLAVRVGAPAIHPIFIVNCNGDVGWRLQAFRTGEWREIWSGETNACFSQPIQIDPGQSRVFAVSRYFEPLGQLPQGKYRVVLHAMYKRIDSNRLEESEQLPEPQRVSNTFLLESSK